MILFSRSKTVILTNWQVVTDITSWLGYEALIGWLPSKTCRWLTWLAGDTQMLESSWDEPTGSSIMIITMVLLLILGLNLTLNVPGSWKLGYRDPLPKTDVGQGPLSFFLPFYPWCQLPVHVMSCVVFFVVVLFCYLKDHVETVIKFTGPCIIL